MRQINISSHCGCPPVAVSGRLLSWKLLQIDYSTTNSWYQVSSAQSEWALPPLSLLRIPSWNIYAIIRCVLICQELFPLFSVFSSLGLGFTTHRYSRAQTDRVRKPPVNCLTESDTSICTRWTPRVSIGDVSGAQIWGSSSLSSSKILAVGQHWHTIPDRIEAANEDGQSLLYYYTNLNIKATVSHLQKPFSTTIFFKNSRYQIF